MSKISAKQVKELRDMTGVGMMDAKNALVETDGDMDAAVDFLRTKGLAKAAKKADRIAAEGLTATYVDGNTAAIVEVNSETDFVSKNEKFQDLVATIVKAVAENKPADIEAAKAIEIDGKTIDTIVTEATTVIGEKLDFRRFAVLTKEDADVFGEYVHAGGSISAIVKITGASNEAVAKDVAMHVAAINPRYVNPDQVDAEVYEHEKQVQTEKSLAEGKPANIVEKMVQGRMHKFLAEISLTEQDFIKEPDLSVSKYVTANGGGQIDSFVRFQVGEGIEKRQDNFADEVAAQMKK
ncbi:translation elongation factor Ts [Eremococcus coleocola]|uniref:Elongation factor Ts n=1 Tax=Eremococcus coleocola ACS-139-V-Col8 TaxID=908337 RepID=E4KQD6_9LACT|nr:translation elongation factor Ts [Eremococcus coleocola]EFR30862.1 translation elongation factor Ts [Eremococcus coleocola ACS-139-V-Col8]